MQKPNTIHLICNAHLDPVWLWEWEEGAAEALSTFRIAADFCDEFDGFVFNHNEVVLYEWVREYDPPLFERIRGLVAAGRWHIMGGWYLQPDCNLPSGESMVRQILIGRRYFSTHFGAHPTTAINFDPFGHSRGLAQILARSGFDSYIFCRPFENDLHLQADEFTWVGFDGSSVIGHRAFGHYLSQPGEATKKIRQLMEERRDPGPHLLLWGVGNHGGGPSRTDIHEIEKLSDELEASGPALVHSTPERYFKAAAEAGRDRPQVAHGLNPWAPGCYTSQIRIKQQHRALEDDLQVAEKLAAEAALRGQMEWPQDELSVAQLDLAFCQFHDILPGSAIPAVEEESLARLSHGRQIARKVIARATMLSLRGDPTPEPGDIPVFACNPHPYPVTGVFAFEIQPSAQNWEGTVTPYAVRQRGPDGEQPVASQIEHEASAVNVDWRKKLAIRATLPPSSLTRFDCTPLEPVDPASHHGALGPDDPVGAVTHPYVFRGDGFEATIGASGLLERYVVGGSEMISQPAFVPTVLQDVDDSWLTEGRRFDQVIGQFSPASTDDVARITGNEALAPVRVIESGPVRTIVESILVYQSSWMIMRHALSPTSPRIDLEITVNWQEPVCMLKMEVPLATGDQPLALLGQTVFGAEALPTDGDEAVAQRWLLASFGNQAVSVLNNGTYGLSASPASVSPTLLRSVAYSAHPTGLGPASVPTDRYVRRMDMGLREYRFALQGGPAQERRRQVEREATAFSEHPRFVMAFPSPADESNPARQPAVLVDNTAVSLVAIKRAEQEDGWIFRLFESTGTAADTTLEIPPLGITERVSLGGYEVRTLLVRDGGSALETVNLTEEPVEQAGVGS